MMGRRRGPRPCRKASSSANAVLLARVTRMLLRRRWISLFFGLAGALLAALLATTATQASEFIEGRVVRVADGDTITVLDAGNRQHRIRLKGIDAPESRQAFGNVSKRALSSMVAGQHVHVRVDGVDRFDRVIGVIFLNGRDINLDMVGHGMAWHYRQFARDQTSSERSAYASAEQEARSNRRGLWADSNPMPPWDFRRQSQ